MKIDSRMSNTSETTNGKITIAQNNKKWDQLNQGKRYPFIQVKKDDKKKELDIHIYWIFTKSEITQN